MNGDIISPGHTANSKIGRMEGVDETMCSNNGMMTFLRVIFVYTSQFN